MIRPPVIYNRSDELDLVCLGRKLWSEVMHELDPDSDLFTKMLALGNAEWDEDLQDMPAFAFDLTEAETLAAS